LITKTKQCRHGEDKPDDLITAQKMEVDQQIRHTDTQNYIKLFCSLITSDSYNMVKATKQYFWIGKQCYTN